jgi:hypothetical protein
MNKIITFNTKRIYITSLSKSISIKHSEDKWLTQMALQHANIYNFCKYKKNTKKEIPEETSTKILEEKEDEWLTEMAHKHALVPYKENYIIDNEEDSWLTMMAIKHAKSY